MPWMHWRFVRSGDWSTWDHGTKTGSVLERSTSGIERLAPSVSEQSAKAFQQLASKLEAGVGRLPTGE